MKGYCSITCGLPNISYDSIHNVKHNNVWYVILLITDMYLVNLSKPCMFLQTCIILENKCNAMILL